MRHCSTYPPNYWRFKILLNLSAIAGIVFGAMLLQSPLILFMAIGWPIGALVGEYLCWRWWFQEAH